MTTEKDKAPQMDWQQVVLNGGPPCFFVEDGRYCGRAERWQGHGVKTCHDFISLDDLLAIRVKEALERSCSAMCVKCRLVEQFAPAERVGNGKRWFHRAMNTSFEDGIASQCDAWPIRNLTLEAASRGEE